MSYLTEFPDFGVMDVEIPKGFIDDSWHNDAMPRFVNEKDLMVLWVDFENRDLSDMPSCARFGLYRYDINTDDQLYSGEYVESLESDNYQDILNKVIEWRVLNNEL